MSKSAWCLIGFIIGVTFSVLITFKSTYSKDNPTPPVEEKRIDTLYVTRDNYLTHVEFIETIKYDTIEEIYNLDDSSTLELFLQLVSE